MKRFFGIALFFLTLSPACLAQQDPDDPGIQDSLIVGDVAPDSGANIWFVPIYAVTDDSVMFYNFPLRWIVHPDGGNIYPITGNILFAPLTQWDDTEDTVVTSEGYIRQIGFSDLGGDPNPCLLTDGYRLHVWNVPFSFGPGPFGYAFIDTTWDSRNGSVMFGLVDGITEITPGFRRGILGYIIDSADEINTPNKFLLSQNYPNPFNPTTAIEFSLPSETRVRLIVYDILGEKIKTLLDETKAPGIYSIIWDGTDDNGNSQSSGTYFYRLTSAENTQSSRMTLIR